MMRLICRIIGGALCFFGILGMLTPIPFGLILFIIGLLFLIPSTPSAANAVRWARRKIRVFDRVMSAATNRMPYPYRRVLRETEIRPDW
ncbi:MAG: hypothetical protein JJ850_03035 [Kordiimonadaceae bacterium]|nr:hypothetical protein [Kordiimonadaceae bacterium]MBO6567216.1 hypothetical protein [Kordiimonadaceae bacterium]MBO6963569.1 hypothetical protein [Kordiimonadaceae bacterium]